MNENITSQYGSDMLSSLNRVVDNSFSFTTLDSNKTSASDYFVSCEEVAFARIFSLTFTFMATLFLCYIIVVLLIYAHKRKFIRVFKGTSHRSIQTTTVVNTFVLLGAIFALFYVGMELPLVTSPRGSFCSVYHRIKIVMYALTVFCVYFALWFRVFRLFYRNPIMKKNVSKVLLFVNVSALPFLFLMIISNLFLFLSAPAYTSAGCGCKPEQSTESNTIKWIVLFSCTTAFQAILLFSFVYPLCMHRKKMLDDGVDHKFILSVVKRAAIVAGFCIACDLLNSVFAIVYSGQTVYVNNIVFSSTLIVNVVGVIASFADWRKKLFPFGEKLEPAPATKHTDLPVATKYNPGSSRDNNAVTNSSDPIVRCAWS